MYFDENGKGKVVCDPIFICTAVAHCSHCNLFSFSIPFLFISILFHFSVAAAVVVVVAYFISSILKLRKRKKAREGGRSFWNIFNFIPKSKLIDVLLKKREEKEISIKMKKRTEYIIETLAQTKYFIPN